LSETSAISARSSRRRYNTHIPVFVSFECTVHGRVRISVIRINLVGIGRLVCLGDDLSNNYFHL
jgi:hypothetical protein